MRELRGADQPRGPALREFLPWVPPALGVCALIVLLVIAATRFTATPEARAVPAATPFLPAPAPPQQPAPARPQPDGSALPGPGPSLSRSPERTLRPATVATSPRPSRTSARATPAPPAAPVSGRYRVVDSYSDGFIGEVLVGNTGGRDSDWQVRLRFPAAVGDLVTSWVESAPQATLTRSGDTFTWRSGVPVPAGGSVALRFHFSRTGSGDRPSVCSVNGLACAGA